MRLKGRTKNIISISLISFLMLALSVPNDSFAVSEESVPVPEKETIVDLSGIDDGQAASDELLVLVEEGTSKKTVSGIASDAGASLDNISTLEDGTRLAKVTLDSSKDAQAIAEEIAADDSVMVVQPNYIYQLDGANTDKDALGIGITGSGPETITGNRISQWYLGSTSIGSTKAENAWKKLSPASSDKEVVVAVIDSGAELNHVDLRDNMIADKCVTFNNGKKGTFTQWDGTNDEYANGHGTHVCGLIAADASDNYGISGISNDRAKIVAIDVTLPNSRGLMTQDLVLGIDYAVSINADVINLSLGGPCRDYLEDMAVDYANDNNVLVVCGAGNDNTDRRFSPSDVGSAVSVMAHDSSGNKANFSNYNEYKDVSAPGDKVLSTFNDRSEGTDSYKYMNGTSMSTPIVSGLAALIKSENKNLNTRELKNFIYTSSGLESFDGSKSGFGMINAENAINNVKSTATAPKKIVLNKTALSLIPGEEFPLEYAVYPGTASTYADETIFSSSNSNVAVVDKKGLITAKGIGTATIRVTCSGITTTCKVSVKDIDYETIAYPNTDITGSFKSTDHKLRALRYNGNYYIEYEALVKGYQIEVKDITDLVFIYVNSNNTAHSFKVLDPDGKEMEVGQYTSEESTPYESFASIKPEKAGVYKIQMLCACSDANAMNYSMGIWQFKDFSEATVSNVVARTYTGKRLTQSPVVKLNGKVLKYGTDYTVTYSNNINTGTAEMILTGEGVYIGDLEKSFRIKKAANGLKVSKKTYKIKRSKLKKKAKKIRVKKLMTVKRANGKLRYAKVRGSKRLSINAKTGMVTIKKKTKKGTYRMTVRVTAAGDRNHKAGRKNVVVTVKVK